MNGFYTAIGSQGSGKTLLITKLALENHTKRPREICSNYKLFGVPFTPIDLLATDRGDGIERENILDALDKDPNRFNHCIILLDEIHIYFDSLDFMRKENRRMQIFFSQLRKRDILLFATTQYIMNLDVRIRRQCKNVFEMEHIYKDLFQVTTHKIDGYFTKEISHYNIVLSDYYNRYDTNEVITS